MKGRIGGGEKRSECRMKEGRVGGNGGGELEGGCGKVGATWE